MDRWTQQATVEPGSVAAPVVAPVAPVSPRASGPGGRIVAPRFLSVTWRTMDVAVEHFVKIRDNAFVEGQRDADRRVASDADKEVAELSRICDYDFIMAFKAPDNSPLPDPERPQGQMKKYGFLPIGIAHDADIGAEAVYVLVGEREQPMPVTPYLRHDVWRELTAVLGQRLNTNSHVALKHRPARNLHVVLLGVGGAVVGRAIDFFYYSVEIRVAGRSEEQGATVEPLPVDVQADDPRQIAQARFWLRDAINRRASDVHIEPGDGSGRLRFRIDGELFRVQDRIPIGDLVQVITWIKAQARMDISERRKPLDGSIRLSYTQGEKRRLIDVRVSTIPTIHGQKMVMRLLDPETLRELAEKGLETTIWSERLRKRFTNALSERDGIVLVTGPTGSGKTTTLNAALFHLLREFGDRRNIVTIEDPVEYNVTGVNQIQVNELAGVTFERALRHILRQDPDVVLVGEIRDPATAAVAVQAALTGHLILATLHTNDALGTVERLLDLGGSAFLIGSTVRLFQAQRLVRTLCRRCGRLRRLEGETLRRKVLAGRVAGYVDSIMAGDSEVFEQDPKGCAACEYSGFQGRMAVMEMAVVTPELIAAIERNATARELAEIAGRSGYRPMIENGIELLRTGHTSLSEIEAISLSVQHGEEDRIATEGDT
jgi:type IV pilus assembly protein PilB